LPTPDSISCGASGSEMEELPGPSREGIEREAAGAKRPLLREAESLGWLAQSSVQPRKRKDIEGVSASSIVDLKAQLYRSQEESRLRAEGVLGPNDSSSRRKIGVDLSRFNRKNEGVEERNRRDVEEVQRAKDRVGECYAALERKAKLYEQIVRGEAPDREDVYQVDFLQKGTLEDEATLLDRADNFLAATLGGNNGNDDKEDQDHRQSDDCEGSPRGERPSDGGWTDEATGSRKERMQVISELARETESGRDRAEALKQRRQEAAAKNRERLKAEFLKKQVAKMRAAKGSGAAKQ